MKAFVLGLTVALAVTGCGEDGEDGAPSAVAVINANCTVYREPDGAIVRCPDGTSAYIANGERGAAGSSCTAVASPGGARIVCTDGTTANLFNGADGEDGEDGRDGTNCTAIAELNGGTIACSDGTRLSVRNGADATAVTAEKVCPNDTSSFPEYVFRLGNEIFAVYFDARVGAFWAKLTPGRYASTNGSGCRFTVNADLSISPN